ncbi:hypothetical protein M8J76_014989 [Diaphorina citri]|nr:hypothetical protein M8J76_014989 [Diaphorina citri]
MLRKAEKKVALPPGGGQKKSILYSNAEWSKLTSYLSEKQRREDNADNRRREMEETKTLSKTITDSFVGSREEQRMRLKLQREKMKYERELKKLEEERRLDNLRVVEQTKLALKKNKDGWKALDSALRLADTLRERKKQLEFKDKIKEVDRKMELEWSDRIAENARVFEEEKRREKQEKLVKKNENFERATQSLQELWRERDRLKKAQVEEERREIEKVQNEIKQIENAEKEAKEKTKQILDEMTRESFLLEMQKKQKEKQQEELDKAAFHIIKQTTRRLTDMKNQIMQERHQAEVEKRERVYQHLSSLMKAAVDNEEERLRKDLEKAEEKYKEQQKLEAERRARLAKEKNEAYEQFMRDTAEAERREREEAKWELLKRCRMIEHDEAQETERKLRDQMKKRNQRADLDTQVEENKIYAEEARLADEDAIQRSALLWQLDDQEVLKYAQQVHQECIDRGRPELPVLIALENYKKANRLVAPRQKNLTQWESNVFPKPVQIRLNKSVP